jgi:hypothetical protein
MRPFIVAGLFAGVALLGPSRAEELCGRLGNEVDQAAW